MSAAKWHPMNVVEIDEFTPVPVPTENIVYLPSGLLGLEHIKKFVLLGIPDEAPFQWLQVLEDPTLAFIVLSPFLVLPDYRPDINNRDIIPIGIESPEDAIIYNIVTLRPGGQATINLRGPIVINRYTLVGKQVVITNASLYSVNHPLPCK